MRGCFLRQQCSRLRRQNSAQRWRCHFGIATAFIRHRPAGENCLQDVETFLFLYKGRREGDMMVGSKAAERKKKKKKKKTQPRAWANERRAKEEVYRHGAKHAQCRCRLKAPNVPQVQSSRSSGYLIKLACSSFSVLTFLYPYSSFVFSEFFLTHVR